MKWISYVVGITVGIAFTFSASLASAEEAPTKINGVVTINSDQAKRLYDIGALFVDVRPHEQWKYGHVEGSHSLDLRAGFRQLLTPGILDKQTPIVIYGNSTYHMRGAIGSYLAALWGYKRVFFLRDGYFSWLARDFPVTLKSDQPEASQVSQSSK